jgi:hypothetical protein
MAADGLDVKRDEVPQIVDASTTAHKHSPRQSHAPLT